MDAVIFDQDGVAQTPSLHDAELWGVRHIDDRLELDFRALSGDSIRLVFLQVYSFSIDALWNRNVTFEVQMHDLSSASSDLLARAIHANKPEGVERAIRERAATHKLVYILPSVGADVVVVCGRVEWATTSKP